MCDPPWNRGESSSLMHAGSGNRRQVFSEINITPLTDIFLVLLIIMMVVAPAMQQARNDIRPPEIEAGGAVVKGQATVDIAGDGKMYLDGLEVGEADLERALRDAGMALKEKKITIRADRTLQSRAVMRVVDAAQASGFEKLNFVGEMKVTSPQVALPPPGAPREAPAP